MMFSDRLNQSHWKVDNSDCAKMMEVAEADAAMEDALSDSAEMDTDASEESDPASTNDLRRTKSQVNKHLQVQAVVRRLEEHQKNLEKLKTQSSLVCVRVAAEKVPTQDTKKAIQECHKSARNLGEDMLEDTLALDTLAGLFSEDRSSRKIAISRLDALLEEIDELKSQLSAAEKAYSSRMDMEDARDHVADEISAKQDNCEDSMDQPSEAGAAIECESPSAFQRTLSQVEKQTHVQGAMDRLETHEVSSQRLKAKVARLLNRVNAEVVNLEDEAKVLADCQKEARNHGEDLVEDMVALDKLSGLFDEDRSNRKKMIASLDKLLEEVDKSKSILGALQTDLHARLESQSKQAVEVPLPHPDFWGDLTLPLQFRTSEERGGYTLVARSGALRADEVQLKLSPDGCRLTISGTHRPSDQELVDMQGTVAQQLSQTGQKPDDLHAVQHLYSKLGRGVFGGFSETFRLPKDVDASRIEASINDGTFATLRVSLPKRLREAMRRRQSLFGDW